jgi:hypothetical protein
MSVPSPFAANPAALFFGSPPPATSAQPLPHPTPSTATTTMPADRNPETPRLHPNLATFLPLDGWLSARGEISIHETNIRYHAATSIKTTERVLDNN